MNFCNVTLTPKDPGGHLRVLILGRISTPHQNLENIEASYAFADEFLARAYNGPLRVKYLGERGSGMRTDRPTILEAEDEIEAGMIDLVLCEDLSRAHRNPRHQMAFVQDSVDAGVRVICIGDNLDTADPNWEVMLQAAALRHGLVVPDTRRRVRRTAEHAFHGGGMVLKVRYGYRKLTREEAESREFGPRGLLVAKRPECTPTIREMKRRVEGGDTYAAVARWLNDEGVETGPYATGGRWTGPAVRNLLADPILHGERTFRRVLSETLFRDGKKKRRKNAGGPEVEFYPELAHLSREEHEGLLRVMAATGEAHRYASGRDHPLYDKPRAQALWPAQHPRCAVCGGLLYRYNAGELKCQGVIRTPAEGGDGFVEAPCWNHVQVDCGAVRERVLGWVLEVCGRFPEFRGALADAAWAELGVQAGRENRAHRALDGEIAVLEKRSANLANAISRGHEMEALLNELTATDALLKDARRRRAEASKTDPSRLTLGSRDDVERHLDWAVRQLASTSYEFAALLRRVIPVFQIVPVQALDTDLVRPRAELVLRLSAPHEGRAAVDDDAPRPGDVRGTLDLFEPAAHVRAIGACLAAKREDPKRSLVRLEALTGVNRMTVRRALQYAALMEREGLTDPYRVLTQPPERASRWRRREAS